ncbi:MAG: ribosome-associated translation inhibitor RaiA [Ruaniaceae bacterium]|nr:ribosome-associated translation inhibitor RaiA [Ruaniaceae bacterium]
MEIVVVGRGTDINDKFRSHVEDKLEKLQQLAVDPQRIEVEVTREKNPRLSDNAERVELTLRGKGPVIRAESSASDRYAAFDMASGKLSERLRRARDRRKDRRKGGGAAPSVPPMPSTLDDLVVPTPAEPESPKLEPGKAVETQLGDSPVVVRQKLHEAVPMSVDQALYEMELVGHPFYLFVEEESKQPAVVYHRTGWTYGVIRLEVSASNEA